MSMAEGQATHSPRLEAAMSGSLAAETIARAGVRGRDKGEDMILGPLSHRKTPWK